MLTRSSKCPSSGIPEWLGFERADSKTMCRIKGLNSHEYYKQKQCIHGATYARLEYGGSSVYMT